MYELFLVLLDADVVCAVVDVDVAVLRPQPHGRLLWHMRLQVALLRGRCRGGLKKSMAKLRELPRSLDHYSRNLVIVCFCMHLQYSAQIRRTHNQACKLKFRLRDFISCLCPAAVCFKGRVAGVDAIETGTEFSQLKL